MHFTTGILAIALAFVLTALFTKIEIPYLRKKQFGQFIREEGPESHMSKQGTPTMGGVAIYAGIMAAAIVCGIIAGANMADMIIIVIAGLLFGLIGFLDDFIKVAKKHNLGLRAWQKLALQVLFAVLLAVYVMKFTAHGSMVWVPVIGDVDFGALYIPFIVFVMVAMANSVNLTDGLDGLCGGVTAIVAMFFGVIISTTQGLFAPGADGKASAVYCFAMAGACLGFLVYNHYPAKIFMGDTGSMALGAGLTAAVILTKTELLIPIAGFVYVMESASVIIQVISFQTTGKRVFRMSPIHHHFELGGMKETKVVTMFWGIACVCSAVALILTRI